MVPKFDAGGCRQPRRPFLSRALVGTTLVAALCAGLPIPAAGQVPRSESTPAGARAQRYRATNPIVVDKATGQRRIPTEEEVAALVTNLATFTDRTTEGVPETAAASGGVSADLGEGFSGLVLSRANEDGTIETRCVFTFDEGAQFLGLVPVIE